MEKIEALDVKISRQLKKIRHEIKYNRRDFWNKNRVNFRNNLKTLVSFFKFPEKWNVNIIASRFLLDKPVMPYDMEVWSFSDVVAATKNQGYEIIIFFNKTDLEFLSAPGLLPIVVHEVKHVYQAAEDPIEYATLEVDDKLNQEYEKEAELEVRKYSDEFRKEYVLENVTYCFDEKGWEGAKKMVKFLYEDSQDSWGGGYSQDMKKEEYEAFVKAEEEKDIDIFIDFMCSTTEPN